MGARQLVKTTASFSNYKMIIEALAGPSAGLRLNPKYITQHFKIHAAEEGMGLVQQFEMQHYASPPAHSFACDAQPLIKTHFFAFPAPAVRPL